MEPKIQTWTWIVLTLLVSVATAGRWVSANHLANPIYNSAKRMSGDEVVYIVLGDRIWKEGRYDTRGLAAQLPLDRDRVVIPEYLEAPLFKHPPMFPFLVGLSRFLFWGVQGSSIYPSLLMGAVSLFALFWLALEMGCSPGQGLLAVLLLAVSPVHWICSSRIWMDVTLMTFILLAVAAQVRAVQHDGWWKWSGFFWGCALLTKYTAFAAWAFAIGGALMLRPELRRDRRFWTGQAIAAAMFLPWLVCRFWFEGAVVLMFWTSKVEDWQSFAQMFRRAWILLPLAGLAWLWLRCSEQGCFNRWIATPRFLAWGTLVFLALVLVMGNRLSLCTLPWSGWGPNELRSSPRDFYLTHSLMFEPVCWWGLVGLVVFRREAAWDLARAVWLGLFLFLTLWGNFQSRYGLPLEPFELLFSVALLSPRGSCAAGSRWVCALSGAWILLSCARSLWIVSQIAINNQFFYF